MQRWLGMYGVPAAKTTVLPNIVPVADVKQIKTNTIPRLFFDGGYAPFKGLHVIIAALKGVTVPYEVYTVGTGETRESLERESRDNKVNVKFHGFVSESEHLRMVATSDVVIFPSLVPEGLGRLALLAMAAGKPVVASRIGGLAETVVDKKTGLLVEPGNVAEWRKALVSICSDEKLREVLGTAGKERFAREFSAESIVAKALADYKKVLV